MAAIASDKTCAGPCRAAAQGDDGADDPRPGPVADPREARWSSSFVILGRHGALSWGEDLEEAYNGMERLEHTCQILKTAHELGGVTELPASEIEVLREMRARMGNRSL